MRPNFARFSGEPGRFSRGRARASARPGFTITELLIAATISLILTYAVVQMFDYVASEARYGRASIELASQLRNAARRINTDLASATAPVRPFADRHGQGYFEYVEGPGTDSIAMIYTEGGPYPTTTAGTYTPAVRTSAIDLALPTTGAPPTVAVESSLGGDIDDILMFTAYNPDEPFRGRYTPYTWDGSTWVRGATTIIESKYAEIAIWTVRRPNGRVNLYRRALLIRPDLSPWRDRLSSLPAITYPAPGYYTDPPPTNAAAIKRAMQLCYQENDLSVRYEFFPNNPPTTPQTAALVCNTLSDLSRRENRFAHVRSSIPNLYPIDLEELQLHDPSFGRTVGPGWMLTNDTTNGYYFEGNDVLLAEVLAFDVKAFDPLATVRLDPNSFALSPSDPGYVQTGSSAVPAAASPTGAFVDLGYNVTQATGTGSTWFTGNGMTKSKLVTPAVFASTSTGNAARYAFRTYCTWSLFYEMNGRDLNNDGIVTIAEGNEDNTAGVASNPADGGTNGIDDDGDGIVDEYDEWDTAPPYPNPLRGVQVTLRVMEPNSRQVRQMSVVQNFTGE